MIATTPEYKDSVNKLIKGRKIVITAFENAWEAVKEKSDLSPKEFADLVKNSRYSDFLFKKKRFNDVTAETYFANMPIRKQLDFINEVVGEENENDY